MFAAAFLWGGLIATALALPFNTAFFKLVDDWLAHHPMLAVILGPNASLMLVAPISAPIAEELAKALGVLLLFWLLRPEFDNMRDGLVYGALVGLGFTWFEAALYVVKMYAKFGVAAYGLQLGAGMHSSGSADTQCSPPFSVRLSGSHFRLGANGCAFSLRYVGLTLAITAHMLNNALPLFATLAKIGCRQAAFGKRTDPRRRVFPSLHDS